MTDILFTKRLFGAAASGGGGTSDGANKSLSNLNSAGEAHFVKPTDYAGTAAAGVIKTNTSYGTSVNSDGVLQAETKTQAEYANLADNIFIGKGTLENVLSKETLREYSTMPTASATYVGQVVKFIGTTTSDYEQGLNYICEEQGGTYSWNYLPADLVASTTDFGLVKPDGTSITINNGIISTTGVKLYTLDGLGITSTNTDIRTLMQAVDAKNLPVGSIITGGVDLTDAPADSLGNSNIHIESYSFTEESTTSIIYRATLTSQGSAPYQWFIEYWNTHPEGSMTWVEAPLAFDSMPTASFKYLNKTAQFVGSDDGIHVQGKFYLCKEVTPVTTPSTYEWVLVHVEPIGSASDFGIVKVDGTTITATDGVISGSITNNVASTSTTSALSANMGKELQDQITHLKGIGRFLSLWNASTGLAQTNPTVSPYTYKTGDYFIVGTIASAGGTNYKPDGSTYTIGTASTVVETEDIDVGYTYYYDGSSWQLQAGGGGTVTDVQINGTSILDASGVANVPLAASARAGVVAAGSSFGSAMSGMYIYPTTSTYEGIKAMTSGAFFVGAGTLKNYVNGCCVNFDASQSLTDSQKTQARTNIGAVNSTITYWD